MYFDILLRLKAALLSCFVSLEIYWNNLVSAPIKIQFKPLDTGICLASLETDKWLKHFRSHYMYIKGI